MEWVLLWSSTVYSRLLPYEYIVESEPGKIRRISLKNETFYTRRAFALRCVLFARKNNFLLGL